MARCVVDRRQDSATRMWLPRSPACRASHGDQLPRRQPRAPVHGAALVTRCRRAPVGRIGPVVLLALLAHACTQWPDASSSTRHVPWRVVDTAWAPPWDATADSVPAYRMVVEARGATDTLTHVIEPWPVAVGDSGVAGLRLRFAPGDAASRREIFRLTLPGKRLRTWPVPGDVWYYYRDVAVSPDGQYVAYVGGDPGTHAVVRRLEGGSVVVRGPVTEPCECDVDRHHARWVSADSFEIAVWGATPQGGWLLVAGRTPTGRFTLDTLLAEPPWNGARASGRLSPRPAAARRPFPAG